jgi:putative intracellular protease/amidase
MTLKTFTLSLVAAFAFPPIAAITAQASANSDEPRNVAIVIYPNVELLDFAGPGEVFAATHTAKGHAFEVFTVAETREPVVSMGFVTVTPRYTFDDCPHADIVVVPGGGVPLDSAKLKSFIQARSKDAELMMSVCNGALVYGTAGLLQGMEVTTHHGSLQSLALIEPTAKVFSNRRFVDNGHVMTSAGISAGIDGALHVVSRLMGEEKAWETAKYMEYDWRPDEIARMHAQPGQPVDGMEGLRLVGSIRKLGLAGALAEFKKLAKPTPENDLNRWGYTLKNAGQVAEAVDLFELTAAAYPTSSNASDSLSEALESKGDVPNAIRTAKECLAKLAAEKGMDEARAQLLRNASSSRIARLSGKTSELKYICPPCGGGCDKVGYLEGGKCPSCSMQLTEKTTGETARK